MNHDTIDVERADGVARVTMRRPDPHNSLDPTMAAELGLATEAVTAGEYEDRVAAVAADLADGPTVAYAAIKRLLRHSGSRDLGAQLTAEVDLLAEMAGTDDYERGYEAFFGNDEPAFEGA